MLPSFCVLLYPLRLIEFIFLVKGYSCCHTQYFIIIINYYYYYYYYFSILVYFALQLTHASVHYNLFLCSSVSRKKATYLQAVGSLTMLVSQVTSCGF